MVSEVILSVLGISISMIFGIVGVYLTIRSRYSGKITFVNEQTIELFDAIGNSLDKLSVTYDGTEVNENLVLLNGAFINSGKLDITKDMAEQPITIKLPEGYKWLTGRVVDSSAHANLEQSDERTISISTGLFRCNEYVRFHALAQLPDTEEKESNLRRFRNALGFEHRIVNTKSIDEKEIQSKEISRKNLKKKLEVYGTLLLFLFGAFGFLLYQGPRNVMVFPYSVTNSKIEKVKVNTTRSNLVKVVSTESEFDTEEPFVEFFEKTAGSPSLIKSHFEFEFYVLSFYLLVIMIPLGLQTFEFYRNRRLLKILANQ